ncbi:Mevalonate kinase [Hirschfeldia incana]|nr:Mevalonate kinase [Hirschfeldia incana]
MEVKARAPGKIILAGEHAVVHGSTAVAAAIDLYTYVTLRPSLQSDEKNNDRLTLQLKDLSLEFTWSVARLKEAIAYDSSDVSPSTPASCSSETLKSISVLVEEQNIPEAKIWLSSGISTFLWLYTSILGFIPATVIITTELPYGSGLGSSAAFCVALTAALIASSSSDNTHGDGWSSLDETNLELLNRWAFEGEKIIHGKPSGIDNTVSAYGNMIKFCSGEIARLQSNMPLRMLITNTKVGRNTKALVSGVSERTVRHPVAMNSVFHAVDSISKEVAAIIQSKDEISITEKEESIRELMEMNQGLLQSMGVSHSSIDTVIQTTLKHKLTSKLTGAGGGGCVLTLLPTLVSGTVVDKVVQELESSGFQCFNASIGGNGAEICF